MRGARVTSKYGERVLQNVRSYHYGIDIVGSDDDLLSLYDGEVVFLTNDDGTGCKTIVTKHHIGEKVLLVQYSHCDSFECKVGDKVVKGQKVATMGNTGNSTGKHLHCGMYYVTDSYKWNYKDRYNYVFDPNEVLKLY